MNLKDRISAFARLGHFMRELEIPAARPEFNHPEEETCFDQLQMEIVDAPHYNGWFTEANVRKAIGSPGHSMTPESKKPKVIAELAWSWPAISLRWDFTI
jgi:hypothetical protein